MRLNLITAVAKNGAIGFRNKLLYRIKDDMRRFRSLTEGHTVLMGSKTFDSLPGGALPMRRNLVLTRSGRQFPNAETAASLDDALKMCADDGDVFVIGGASVYAETMPMADRLYITEIYDEPKEADAFFPEIPDDFDAVWAEYHGMDENAAYEYSFVNYERK